MNELPAPDGGWYNAGRDEERRRRFAMYDELIRRAQRMREKITELRRSL